MRQGNDRAAAQVLQQAVAAEPGNPVAYYDLGLLSQRMGDTHGALHQYNLALLRDPQYVPALFNEAVVYSAHAPDLAIFYYRQVIRIQPNSPTAYLNLGLLELAAAGQTAQGHRDLTEAVQLDPALRSRIPAGT